MRPRVAVTAVSEEGRYCHEPQVEEGSATREEEDRLHQVRVGAPVEVSDLAGELKLGSPCCEDRLHQARGSVPVEVSDLAGEHRLGIDDQCFWEVQESGAIAW